MKIDTTKLNCESCKHYKVCQYKKEVQALKKGLEKLIDIDDKMFNFITFSYQCDYYGIENQGITINQPFVMPYTTPCIPNKIEPNWIGDDPNYVHITCSSTSKQDPNVKITAINGETYQKDKFTKDWELSN